MILRTIFKVTRSIGKLNSDFSVAVRAKMADQTVSASEKSREWQSKELLDSAGASKQFFKLFNVAEHLHSFDLSLVDRDYEWAQGAWEQGFQGWRISKCR